MFVWGPVIIALIIGFIIGSRLKNKVGLTFSSFIVVFIAAILFAWQYGQFPYYGDFNIATPFVSAAIGLLLGKLVFDR